MIIIWSSLTVDLRDRILPIQPSIQLCKYESKEDLWIRVTGSAELRASSNDTELIITELYLLTTLYINTVGTGSIELIFLFKNSVEKRQNEENKRFPVIDAVINVTA